MKFVARFCISALLFLLTAQYAWAINLYQPDTFQSLTADHKAMRPGDILTVLVMETSQAQTGADLASGKDIKAALEAGFRHQRESGSLRLSGQGRSSAKTGRNGKIKASLSVRIVENLPHNRYRVEGLQRIGINGEEQIIRLHGLVRMEDISPQNTILSTRLADAHITYTGKGAVSNSQDHDYLYKLLSFVGLV